MIKGKLYEKNSSNYKDVELLIKDNTYSILFHKTPIYKAEINRLTISPRIGNTLRTILQLLKMIKLINIY